jgi:hypothetical protein
MGWPPRGALYRLLQTAFKSETWSTFKPNLWRLSNNSAATHSSPPVQAISRHLCME